jgi:hypothetical protein
MSSRAGIFSLFGYSVRLAGMFRWLEDPNPACLVPFMVEDPDLAIQCFMCKVKP